MHYLENKVLDIVDVRCNHEFFEAIVYYIQMVGLTLRNLLLIHTVYWLVAYNSYTHVPL